MSIGPTRLDATIALPHLSEVRLYGATAVAATGAFGSVLTAELQGASQFVGSATTYRSVNVEAHGASRLDLADNSPIVDAIVNASGSSDAVLNMELGGRIEGAAMSNASVRYYGDDVEVELELASGGQVARLGPTR